MGHSAKYGAYTLLCAAIMKIVQFELLQVNIPILCTFDFFVLKQGISKFEA